MNLPSCGLKLDKRPHKSNHPALNIRRFQRPNRNCPLDAHGRPAFSDKEIAEQQRKDWGIVGLEA
jgi:hypothetical protein